MADYSFYVFGPTELGTNSFTRNGTVTVNGAASTMVVTDDDTVFEDEGQARDLSQQVLQAGFGGVPAGNVVQSVYRTAVFNQTTGQSGFDYGIRMYASADPASPGGQSGSYYHAFSIRVSSGDVLVYGGNGTSVDGQVSYTSLVGPNTPVSAVLSINSVTLAEGSGADTNFVFTVTRDNTNGSPTATYTIANVTTDSADFGAGIQSTGTVTFAAGATTATISVPVAGDYLVEGNEFFSVTLSNPANATIAANGGVGIGTITNDDSVGSISVADVSVAEGDTGSVTGYFTVTRSGGSSPATVSYAIQSSGSAADTTATSGVDYSAAASGTVSFGVGQTTALVPFQVLGDTLVERPETFRIQLTGVTDGGIIGRSVGVATIVDNDVTSNTQFGTSGNDILIANVPGAILVGEGGNDTYLVNNSTDQVIEQAGGGADIVYTTVSYNLGVNEVEALSVANQQTTNSVNLIGNYASQTIVGNYGDNVLNGGSGGVDTLIGLFGNDTYAVGDSRTVVVEQAGQGFDTLVTSVNYTLAAGVSIETFTAQDRASTTGLRLVGNEVSQTIAGTAGNDTIMGGGGSDTLLGGAGADTFVIGTVASGNVAVLADFVSGTDRIGLSTTAFAGLGTALDANEFVVGSAAVGTNAQIVYNQATGQLIYDADGTGSGAAVLFAQVVPGTVINTSAFDMIAPTAMAA